MDAKTVTTAVVFADCARFGQGSFVYGSYFFYGLGALNGVFARVFVLDKRYVHAGFNTELFADCNRDSSRTFACKYGFICHVLHCI